MKIKIEMLKLKPLITKCNLLLAIIIYIAIGRLLTMGDVNDWLILKPHIFCLNILDKISPFPDDLAFLLNEKDSNIVRYEKEDIKDWEYKAGKALSVIFWPIFIFGYIFLALLAWLIFVIVPWIWIHILWPILAVIGKIISFILGLE
ncbi:hypothetical protein KKA15_01225 [Patescibacteria group bacterium]|nr:hypothetical protein [Patescibacteria group bacterium]